MTGVTAARTQLVCRSCDLALEIEADQDVGRGVRGVRVDLAAVAVLDAQLVDGHHSGQGGHAQVAAHVPPEAHTGRELPDAQEGIADAGAAVSQEIAGALPAGAGEDREALAQAPLELDVAREVAAYARSISRPYAWFDAMRGETTNAVSSLPARNVAASVVRK